MKMREKPGGLQIPAGGSVTLKPGGDHLMVMGLTKPVTAGDTVTVTLTLQGGQTTSFTATAKTFAGAEESYHSSSPATQRSSTASQ